jgi:hypothetical protein
MEQRKFSSKFRFGRAILVPTFFNKPVADWKRSPNPLENNGLKIVPAFGGSGETSQQSRRPKGSSKS